MTNVNQVLWVKIVNSAWLVTLLVPMVVVNHVDVILLAPILSTLVRQLVVNVNARKRFQGVNVTTVLEATLESNVINVQMTISGIVLLDIALKVLVPRLVQVKDLTMEHVFVRYNLLVTDVINVTLDIQENSVIVVMKATLQMKEMNVMYVDVILMVPIAHLVMPRDNANVSKTLEVETVGNVRRVLGGSLVQIVNGVITKTTVASVKVNYNCFLFFVFSNSL